MKRALMVTAGTAAGLAAALSYTPRMALPDVSAAATTPAPAASGAPAATSPATSQPAAASTTNPPSSSPTATSPAAPSGTFTGSTVGTRYGGVQVAVTLAAGKLTAVTALAFPSADTKSAAVSDQAIPLLREETIAAQSAEVATISGATYTSKAWQESLAAALAQAGL